MSNQDGQSTQPESVQRELDQLIQANEFARRQLAALEQSVTEIRKNNFQGLLWFMGTFLTVLFGLVSFFLAFTANQSKTDVREDLREMRLQLQQTATDMEAKVDKAISNMNQQFTAIAGESLKRPILTIYNYKGPLEGQALKVANAEIQLYPIFVKNVGDKVSGNVSARLYSSSAIFSYISGIWHAEPSDNTNYPYCYSLPSYTGTLAPQEISAISDQMEPSFSWVGGIPNTNKILCIFQVFYGSDKPAEAKFQINLR